MHWAFQYIVENKKFRTTFWQPKAQIPIITSSGEIQLITWGRRKNESGLLPLGGWARLNTIYNNHWDKFNPRPIRLVVSQFLETNFKNYSIWLDVISNQYIQGLMASWQKEKRVYVVTIHPALEGTYYQRWPRIIMGNNCKF